MIKKNILFFIVIMLLSNLYSCNRASEVYERPESVTQLTPAPDEDSISDDEKYEDSFSIQETKPNIVIRSDETVLSTINLNLDLDTSDEQIIVLKNRQNPALEIYIAVADYDNVKGDYVRVWEGTTSATSGRSFSVYLEDLVGDHSNQIVCSGRDSEGNTTLDVFWRNNESSGSGLNYSSIFSLKQPGAIEIIPVKRSMAYESGQKDGVSYTISASTEKSGNDGKISLIQSIYFWDFPLKKFIKLKEEELEYTTIEEKQLADIYSGPEENFYAYINGPWFTENSTSWNNNIIVLMDPKAETITFYSDRIQENFKWTNSYKVLSNLLYIRAQNEIINYIEIEVYVRIVNLDEIRLTVKDIDNQTRVISPNDVWTDNYYRMGEREKFDTIKTLRKASEAIELPELNGQYISDAGDIIEFYGTSFHMKNSFEEISGGYAVYSADTPVLSLKIVDDSGIEIDTRAFSIDFSEENKNRIIERTLVMVPGELSIYGFKPSDTEYYRFTQTETLDMSSENE